MDIRLTPSKMVSSPELLQLLQDYLRELSAWSGQKPDADDHFDYPYLDHYKNPDRELLLIEASVVEGTWQTIGFAMIRTEQDGMSDAGVRELAEYYIKPDARRRGVGFRALALLLQDRPGQWQLGVFPENQTAVAFWQSSLDVLGSEIEVVPPVGPRVRHLFFNFLVRQKLPV